MTGPGCAGPESVVPGRDSLMGAARGAGVGVIGVMGGSGLPRFRSNYVLAGRSWGDLGCGCRAAERPGPSPPGPCNGAHNGAVHAHSHSGRGSDGLTSTSVRRALVLAVVPFALVTVAGLVL